MAIVKHAMAFNIFQRFATSELTHSGIWAWIIQSLDDDGRFCSGWACWISRVP